MSRKNTTKRIAEPEKARESSRIHCNLQQKQLRTIHRNNKNLEELYTKLIDYTLLQINGKKLSMNLS